MSDSVRPEIAAFRELEVVVRRAARELAAARREGSDLLGLAPPEEPGGSAMDVTGEDIPGPDLRPFDLERRLAAAERENAILRERLAAATARARQMLERVHFLRQQTQVGGER
jgi:hypothetical protein